MPSAVARTATLALTQATLPLALDIANHGLAGALAATPGLREGVQTFKGKVTHAGLAQDTARTYTALDTLLTR
jgi:alanine dehydrogenase